MVAYEVRSDIKIIGNNPELADYNNPNGYIFGEQFFVIATFPDGKRFQHELTAAYTMGGRQVEGQYSLNELERFAAKLNKLQPALNPQHWQATEPCYGSPAWQDYEPQLAQQERMVG